LRRVNALTARAAQSAGMFRAMTHTAFADRDEAPSAVPAAWPTGFARLGVTVTCERCDVLDACEDWRASAPVKRDKPPFCPDRFTS
jgi:hypothetical protein